MIINIWEHKMWGDNIQWQNWEKRVIVGWLTPAPQVGGEVRAKLESGKVGCFKIESIDQMRDPGDMFFATLSDIGYLE